MKSTGIKIAKTTIEDNMCFTIEPGLYNPEYFGIRLENSCYKKDGKIYLIDEIHTPDSSRYFYAEGYQERFDKGESQKQLSKEFVREWLMENGFQGKENQQVPEMTDEKVNSISDRYIELYECITGEKFVKESSDAILHRVERNILQFLQECK